LVFLISSTQYGFLVTKQLDKQYFAEYIDSSLKTIMYVTVPRGDSASISDAKEVDYLITAIKEDYADDSMLDDYRETLTSVVKGVMAPQSDVFNYVFYIHIEPDPGSAVTDEFVYMYLKWTKYALEGEGRYKTVSDAQRVEYYCNPVSMDDFTNNFLVNIGDIFQSSTTIKLPKLTQSRSAGSHFETEWPVATAYLLMWHSGEVPEPNDGLPLLEGDNSHLRCCVIGTSDCPPVSITP